MNPTNISIGKNNRTTCIRIPYSLPKRIEHRLSYPDIDLYIAIYVIVKSIYNGLKNPKSIPHYDIIYGNAFDAQYNCKPFPKSLREAKDLFNKDFFIVDL
jgi:glutamine synthetase